MDKKMINKKGIENRKFSKSFFNKKGQATIFIIAAIVIVGMIILFFALAGKKEQGTLPAQQQVNPAQFIEDCAKIATENAIEIMLPQGGFVNPTNYKTYNDTNITYLCQNTGSYRPCINQHPVLISEMINEIQNNITPVIASCFRDMKTKLEAENYKVTLSPELEVNVSLTTDKAFINVKKRVVIEKSNETRIFEETKLAMPSPIYNLADIAREIVAGEARFCFFEYDGYSIEYPRYRITKDIMSESTKIYTIKDNYTNKVMQIAIRSCAIPPGA